MLLRNQKKKKVERIPTPEPEELTDPEPEPEPERVQNKDTLEIIKEDKILEVETPTKTIKKRICRGRKKGRF